MRFVERDPRISLAPALMANADALLSERPKLEMVEILAAKL